MAKIKQAPAELRRAQLVHHLAGLSTRRIYSQSGTAATHLTAEGRPWFGLVAHAATGTLIRVMELGVGITRKTNGKRTTEIRLEKDYEPSGYELRFGGLLASLPDSVDLRSVTEADLMIVELLRAADKNEVGIDKGTLSTVLPTLEGWEHIQASVLNKRLRFLEENGVLELGPKKKGKHHYAKVMRLLPPFTTDTTPGTHAEEAPDSTLERLLAEEAAIEERARVESELTAPDRNPELDYDKLAKSLLLEALHAVAHQTDGSEIVELRAQVAQLQAEGRTANDVIKSLGNENESLKLRVRNQDAEIAAMEKKGYRIRDLVSDPEREALDRLIREVPSRRAV